MVEKKFEKQLVSQIETLLAKIFASDQPTTREGMTGEKGTGVGMPIVKMFVEKYDGKILIESRSIETQ